MLNSFGEENYKVKKQYIYIYIIYMRKKNFQINGNMFYEKNLLKQRNKFLGGVEKSSNENKLLFHCKIS